MNFDELQKSWQSQDAAREITIDADLLLHEVRRNQQCFRQTIFWRDVREVGVAALLVPVFLYSGWRIHWTLFLCALGCLLVGVYMVVDRRRHKRKTPDLHDSLKDCVVTSLAEIDHQIWLLKNILWWYLLPILVPILLFFGWCAWSTPGPLTVKIIVFLVLGGTVSLLYAGIYWLNQVVVKKDLEPRRQELIGLLHELE